MFGSRFSTTVRDARSRPATPSGGTASGLGVNILVVTLGGTASTKEAEQRAIEIAKDAPGVMRVVNQITIQPDAQENDDGTAAAGDEPEREHP